MGSKGEADWYQAASAIKTTDTFSKVASQIINIDGENVHICGIAKGSGMIAPDMATMLGFIVTDAKIEKTLLQKMLSETNDKSFNSITVDNDTSTNDMVLMAATGASKVNILSQGPNTDKFFSTQKLADLSCSSDSKGWGRCFKIYYNKCNGSSQQYFCS